MPVFLACSQGQKMSNDSFGKLVFSMKVDVVQLSRGWLVINSEFHNNLDTPVSFLPWNTPFDTAVNGHFFSLFDKSNGNELTYKGLILKRRAAQQSDYITVLPGATLSGSLDISENYTFCSNGKYTLSFVGGFYDDKSNALPIEVKNVEIALGNTFKDCGQL